MCDRLHQEVTMEASESNPVSPANAVDLQSASPRSLSITILAAFSLLLGIVTGISQLYYVLYAINPHVFPIGPNANPLGAVWFNYILNGQQGGYLHVDAGTLAGAIEDAFMMGPLYVITGIGLLSYRRWA